MGTLTISIDNLKEMIIETLQDEGYTAKKKDIKITPNGCFISNTFKYISPIQQKCTHTDFDNKSAFRKHNGKLVCSVCGLEKEI